MKIDLSLYNSTTHKSSIQDIVKKSREQEESKFFKSGARWHHIIMDMVL